MSSVPLSAGRPPAAMPGSLGAAATSATAGGGAVSARDRSLRTAAWRLGVLGLCLAITVQPFRDPDVWWHLAVGRLIARQGIPGAEPFSFAPTASAWVGQQWLYERLLAGLVDGGGAGLAMVVMGVLGALAFVVAGLCVRREEGVGDGWVAAAVLLGCLSAGTVLGVRGQVITVLGTALTLLIITRWRTGAPRAVWALPPLLLVWANLHAGFVIGIGIALLAALVVAIRRRAGGDEPAGVRGLLIAVGAGAVATLVNPAGPRLYGYIAQTFLNPTLTGGIVEWRSPDFHDAWLRLFEVCAVALVMLWGVSGRRLDPLDVVLALAAIAATLQAQRNLALFAVIAVPQLARYGSAGWARLRGGRRRPLPAMPAVLAMLAAAAVVALVVAIDVIPGTATAATATFEAEHEPEAAVTFVAAHLHGQRLLSTYEWGGYLAERLGGDPRVVWIYGESAVFGDARLQEYRSVVTIQPGWLDVISRAGMRHAVLPRTSPVASALLATGWVPLCRDGRSDAVVLEAPAEIPRPAEPGFVSGDPTQAAAC